MGRFNIQSTMRNSYDVIEIDKYNVRHLEYIAEFSYPEYSILLSVFD